MQIRVAQKDIWRGIQSVQRAVAVSSAMEVLTGIHLQTTETGLELVATNIDLSIRTEVPVETIREGQVVVEGKYLAEIIRRLPGEDMVDLQLDEEGRLLEVRSSSSVFKLKTLPSREFPQFPQPSGGKVFEIEADKFSDLVSATAFAVASEAQTQLWTTGVRLEIGAGELRMIGTDTHRLAFARTSLAEPGRECAATISAKDLREMARLIGQGDERIKIVLETRQVFVWLKNSTIVSRLVDGDYPNYQKAIPTFFGTTIGAQRSSLLEALERVSAIAKGPNPTMKMEITEEMAVLTIHGEVGSARVDVGVSKEGEDVTIAFDASYMRDGLRNLHGEELEIYITDPNKATKWVAVSNPDAYYVLMPIKL